MARLRPRRARGGPSSAAEAELRRLRLRLTLLFTVALGLGLLVLAVLVLQKDSALRHESLEAEMKRRVTASSRLLYYSNQGKLRLDGVRDDDITKGTPEIRVLAGTGSHPRQVFESFGPHLPVPYSQLAAISQRAVRSGSLVATTLGDGPGPDIRLVAGPFYGGDNGGPAGAVVSAASLAPAESSHNELVLTVAIGCGVLLLLASGAGFLLAGRSLAPAARSIAQQEALLADAAHELRTPVASIRASLEAAQLDPSTTAEQVERARSTSERMGETLGALLALGRLEAGAEREGGTDLRLDQLVEDLIGELDPTGAVAVAAAPSVVRGDPRLIRTAVRNLVDNAMRHGGGADGRVEVEVTGGAVLVADRGPGMPDSVLDGSFTRFEPGKEGGSGLGLSIAARVAEVHGGSLEASPRPGGGTVVRLSLPALPVPGGEVPGPRVAPPPTSAP